MTRSIRLSKLVHRKYAMYHSDVACISTIKIRDEMRFSGPLEPLTLCILGIDCDGACQKTGVGLAYPAIFCMFCIHSFLYVWLFEFREN